MEESFETNYKNCKCYLEHVKIKNKILQFKCSKYNKNHGIKFNKDLTLKRLGVQFDPPPYHVFFLKECFLSERVKPFFFVTFLRDFISHIFPKNFIEIL